MVWSLMQFFPLQSANVMERPLDSGWDESSIPLLEHLFSCYKFHRFFEPGLSAIMRLSIYDFTLKEIRRFG